MSRAAGSRRSIETIITSLSADFHSNSRLKDNLVGVMDLYRSLGLKAVDFVNDDGTIEKLPVLHGTLPIVYKANQYNLPLEIYVSR